MSPLQLRGGGCGASTPSRGTDEVSFPAVHKGKTYIVSLTEKQKQALVKAAKKQAKVAAKAEKAAAKAQLEAVRERLRRETLARQQQQAAD